MMNSNLTKNKILRKLSTLDLDNISKKHGFHQRCRKTTPIDFVVSFFIVALQGGFSFSSWAIQMGLILKKTISKQAVWKRLDSKHYSFLQEVLKKAIATDLDDFMRKSSIDRKALFNNFDRVILQDSTTIHLPDSMASFFKGNYSNGQIKSLAKIQAYLDIKKNQFTQLKLAAYQQNDQKEASESLSFFKKGDLIIRDLGYFVIDVFTKIDEKGAFFISKYKYGVHLYNKQGERLSISQLIKKRDFADEEVLLGKSKVPVRMVIVRVSESIAEERRRKARKDRHKNANHSEEFYKILGYTIMITNVNKEVLSLYEIIQAYSLRWRIEIIFKTWKSNLNLEKAINHNIKSPFQVRVVLYYLLTYSVLIQVNLYNFYWWKIYSTYRKHLSLMLFTKFLTDNLHCLMTLKKQDEPFIEELLAKGCCYEKRQNRKNFMELYFQTILLS